MTLSIPIPIAVAKVCAKFSSCINIKSKKQILIERKKDNSEILIDKN
jgi:hypothetical protein